MAILFEKEKDLYIGPKGFQSSIFLIQVQARLSAGGRAYKVRPENAFDDALKDGVQAVIIKDEDLVQGNISVRYTNGDEATFPEKDVESFVISELTGDIYLYCEEDEDAEGDDNDDF